MSKYRKTPSSSFRVCRDPENPRWPSIRSLPRGKDAMWSLSRAMPDNFSATFSKPDVDSIDGLSPPSQSIRRRRRTNPRSTVGTVTEIYDYLRLLYARIGVAYCPSTVFPSRPLPCNRFSMPSERIPTAAKSPSMPRRPERKGTHLQTMRKFFRCRFHAGEDRRRKLDAI